MREEASKREEEFFIAEDHTYAVVDKSKKRKVRKSQKNEGSKKREGDTETESTISYWLSNVQLLYQAATRL